MPVFPLISAFWSGMQSQSWALHSVLISSCFPRSVRILSMALTSDSDTHRALASYFVGCPSIWVCWTFLKMRPRFWRPGEDAREVTCPRHIAARGCDVDYLITDGVDFGHLVEMVSARHLHCKVIICFCRSWASHEEVIWDDVTILSLSIISPTPFSIHCAWNTEFA